MGTMSRLRAPGSHVRHDLYVLPLEPLGDLGVHPGRHRRADRPPPDGARRQKKSTPPQRCPRPIPAFAATISRTGRNEASRSIPMDPVLPTQHDNAHDGPRLATHLGIPRRLLLLVLPDPRLSRLCTGLRLAQPDHSRMDGPKRQILPEHRHGDALAPPRALGPLHVEMAM